MSPLNSYTQDCAARFRVAVLVFAGLWMSGVAAKADDTAEPPAYRETVAEALEEYQAQNYLEAHALFARAHALWPSARTFRGLGVVSFELHRYSESVRALEQALASDRKPLDPSMREDTKRLLARAWSFVARLKLSAEPPDAVVAIDGLDARPLTRDPLLLDLGPHQLEFRAPGHVSERRAYIVAGGESATWKISLQRVGAPAPVAKRSVPREPWKKVLSGTAVVIGVAALVAAGVFTSQHHDAGKRYRLVDPNDTEKPRYLQKWEQTRALPLVFAGVGASALTSGAVGMLLSTPNGLIASISAGVSGAAGVGLAAWGIYDLLSGDACGAGSPDRQQCSDKSERRDRGAVILLSAVPWLAVPITQLLRRRSDAFAVTLRPHYLPQRRMAFFDVSTSW
ncbi:MAG: hypothetical protein RLZZ450_6322 [Pseudomonadota bacterium]|jgi:hypothetical protein